MSVVLEAIRARIGPPPRNVPPQDRAIFMPRPPVWLRRRDPLRLYYRSQEMLLTEGVVVWGAFVHADLHAFEPGPCDVPGLVIHPTDPRITIDPDELAAIAQDYYDFRKADITEGNRDFIASMITAPIRILDEEVPASIAKRLPLRATSTMIRRAFLPAGILAESCVPLLIHPRTKFVMIVPSRAWPVDFAKSWRAELLGYPALTAINDFVTITQFAVDMFRQNLIDAGGNRNWYIHCYVNEPTDGFSDSEVQFDYSPYMDETKQILSRSLGFQFVIRKTQRDLLAGTVVGRNLPQQMD